MYGQRCTDKGEGNMRLEDEKCKDRLEVRIGEQTKEVLQDLAEIDGKTASDYVRTLILKDISRKRKKILKK
jgi:uncharacterized protein (DUF1778 family)